MKAFGLFSLAYTRFFKSRDLKTFLNMFWYLFNQSRFADVSDSELKEIDHKIAQLSERLKATESTNHKLESRGYS